MATTTECSTPDLVASTSTAPGSPPDMSDPGFQEFLDLFMQIFPRQNSSSLARPIVFGVFNALEANNKSNKDDEMAFVANWHGGMKLKWTVSGEDLAKWSGRRVNYTPCRPITLHGFDPKGVTLFIEILTGVPHLDPLVISQWLPAKLETVWALACEFECPSIVTALYPFIQRCMAQRFVTSLLRVSVTNDCFAGEKVIAALPSSIPVDMVCEALAEMDSRQFDKFGNTLLQAIQGYKHEVASESAFGAEYGGVDWQMVAILFTDIYTDGAL